MGVLGAHQDPSKRPCYDGDGKAYKYITTKYPLSYRIITNEQSGRARVAFDSGRDKAPVYRQGDLLSQLVGELYPSFHPNCDKGELALPNKYHLHWKDNDIWACHIQYSCNPCAKIVLKAVGCRRRVVIVATKDIV